ncbi:MAG TPA: MBOAT family protein, partial [Clostridium sp.]|nr:MBOAT family protein [Clostridium sp.]
ISFYTFQSVGYLIDVYREKYEPERNLAKFALFISFFPQIVQGPIGRYNDLAEQLYR